MSAERKKNILLHLLGSEGQDIFRSLPKTERQEGEEELDDFEEVLFRLDLRFKPNLSITLERYHFYTRKQADNESFDDFLTALRGLSITCEFGLSTDEMIRDQLMVNTNYKKVKEHLWVMGNPSLNEVIRSAKAIEQSMKWVKEVNTDKSDDTKQTEVCVTRPKPTRNSAQDYRRSGQRLMCYRCGSVTHLANAKDCPARGRECAICKKTGHFARVCKEKKGFENRKVSHVSEEFSLSPDEGESYNVNEPRVLMVLEEGFNEAA